jgi:hypothetical protein
MPILSHRASYANLSVDMLLPVLSAFEQLCPHAVCRSAFHLFSIIIFQKIQNDCSEIVVAFPPRQYNVRGLLIK